MALPHALDPIAELRPTLTSAEVIRAALEGELDEMLPYLEGTRYTWDTFLDEAVKAYQVTPDPDAFTVALYLRNVSGITVDMEFCLFLHRAFKTMGLHFRRAVQNWVIRSGVRFPYKDGTILHYRNPMFPTTTSVGQVIAVNRDSATAVIQPHNQGRPIGAQFILHAEDVIGAAHA